MSSELYSTPQQPPKVHCKRIDLFYISSLQLLNTQGTEHDLTLLQWTWTGLDNNNNVNDGRNRTRSSGKSISSVDERANRIDSRTLHKTRATHPNC